MTTNLEGIEYEVSFQTVDIILIDKNQRILLGQKSTEDKWRMPGGFVDVADQSLEMAASREMNEETLIKIIDCQFKYLFSARIKDERYENSKHKILTAVMMVNSDKEHTAKAGDDLEKVKWFDFNKFSDLDLLTEFIHLSHVPLLFDAWLTWNHSKRRI